MAHFDSSHAKWFSHINGVRPAPAIRKWLTDSASLTAKLTARCDHFRVQRLHQQQDLCLPDECLSLQLSRPSCVWEREVLLLCDGSPRVFAHTVVPLTANASDWPLFGALGERSLGSTLFGDPQVRRGQLQFARLRQGHELHVRACNSIGARRLASPLYARRCLYRRKNGLLLLTEVFLPAILELDINEATQEELKSRQ